MNIRVDSGCTDEPPQILTILSTKMADFWSTIDDAFKTCAITQKCGQLCINDDGTEKVEESYLVLNYVPFQDKADTSKSNGAFQTHDTKDFQSHQQHQPQSSIASPSIKQPFHQEGGPSTGQHANVIIPRGGRRPSGKQVN